MSPNARQTLGADADLWQTIMRLTTEMLGAATDGNWEAVTGFEEQRSRHLRGAVSTDAADPECLAGRISELLEVDRQIIALASDARQRASGELISLHERARRNRRYRWIPSG